MKRALTLLLALSLLAGVFPAGAFASEGLITAEKLTAAVSLTGVGENAPSYHAGMAVDETMTAKQLIYWLEDVLNVYVHTLENHYEDTENALYELSEVNPAEYTRLTEGRYKALPRIVHRRFNRTVDTRLRLEHWRDLLTSASSTIQMGEAELTENLSVLSDYDVRRISFEIRQASEQIRSVRSEMADQAEKLLKDLKEQIDYLNGHPPKDGGSHYLEDNEYSEIISGWRVQVTGSSDQVQIKTVSSSVAGLFPQQKSLLGRLNPISSAEAAGENEVILTILNDHQFAITVKDENNKHVEGAHVKVTDIRATDGTTPKTDEKDTGESGSVVFETDGWVLKDDKVRFSLEITKEGYKTILMDTAEVKKGSNVVLQTAPHNNEPYIARVSFDGRDCLYSEYEAISNPKNTRENDILVTVVNPSQKTVRVNLEYIDKDGNPYFRTMKTSAGGFEVKGGETQDLTINAMWRARLTSGKGKLSVKKDGKDEKQDDGVLMLLLQESSTNDTDSFKEGYPSWTEDATVVKTQLKTVAAKLTSPVVSSKLNGPFFKSFDIIGIDVPLLKDSDGFLSNINIGIGLPLSTYIPRIYGATNGAIMLLVGINVPKAFDESLSNTVWQNQDSKDIDETVKSESKIFNMTSTFEKTILQAGDTYRGAQKKGGLGLKKVTADIYFFFGLQFNWEYDSQSGKWVGVDMSGLGGIIGSLDATFSHTWVVGGFPLLIGFNFNASLTFGASLGGTIALRQGEDLTEDSLVESGIDPQFSGGSVDIRLTGTVFAGAGFKGLLSFTLNFYAYFNILFEITGVGSHIQVSFGCGFFIQIEALFIKIKLNIWDLTPPLTIVDKTWEWGYDASLPSFSDLFITRAKAEDAGSDPGLVLKADNFPDLVPDSEKILGPVAMSGSAMQVLEIQGEPYAFYIAEGAGSNGKNRITWRRISTGQTGTFDQVLKDASEKKRRYTIREGVSLDTGYIDKYFEDYYADMNSVFYGQDDLSFTVQKMNEFGSDVGNIMAATYREMYMLTAMTGSVEVTDGVTHALENPQVYCLAFRPLEDGSLTCDFPAIQDSELNSGDSSPVYQLNDDMVCRLFQSGDLMRWTRLSADELVQLSLSAVSTFEVDGPMTGEKWEQEGLYNLRGFGIASYVIVEDCNIKFTLGLPQFHRTWSGDTPNVSFRSQSFESYIHGDFTNGEDARRSGRFGSETSFYSISADEESGLKSLRLSDYNGISMSLAEQENIVSWNLLPGPHRDLVFWLVQDGTEDTGIHLHMHSAVVNHTIETGEDRTDLLSDLDVEVTGLDFSIQQVGSTVYVYWPEFSADPDEKDRTICRLRGIAFDPIAGIASDDFILAQFAPSSEESIKQILLTEDGYGYYVTDENLVEAGSGSSATVNGTVYRFPFQLVAAMDLELAELTQDVIGIGENDTVVLRLINNGNVAITTFDITENLVAKDGSVSTVETVHCDTVTPDNSWLHMEGDDSINDIRGDHAAWRIKWLMEDVTQTYWQVKQTHRTYYRPDELHEFQIIDTTEEAEISTSEILPGQVAVCTIMLKVPSSWRNEQRLRFDLVQYTATPHVMRSAALRAGLIRPSYALSAEPEMVYVRGANGKMQLQQTRNLLTAGNGSSLYAAEVDSAGAAILDHSTHNIVVDYRLYTDLSGERRVSIYITDDAVHKKPVKWYGNVYFDLSDSPVYVNLPYEEDSTSHARTHTLDMPVSALTNGKKANRIKVDVRGVGIEEMTLRDNFFYIDLENRDPLQITLQPENVTVNEGESASFFTGAGGGTAPYKYQWQISDGKGGWQDVADAAQSSLTLNETTLDNNGSLYRCVVTDFNGATVTSASALLTVTRPVPKTGDTGSPALWLLLLILGFACLTVLAAAPARKRKN